MAAVVELREREQEDGGEPGLGDVRAAVDVLRRFVARVEVGCFDARAARSATGLFAEAGRLCDTATTFFAGRVAGTQVWAETGARSPAEWVARVTGAPIGQAIGRLEVAERLGSLPGTEAELRAGRLSPAQARVVTEAAVVAPGAEAELLAAASRSTMRGLTERARAVKAAANPLAAERRYEAAHRARDLSTWVDADGAGRLAWSGTTVALAHLKHALAPYVRAELTAARKAGRDEPYGACAADALLAMTDAAGSPDALRPPRPAAHEVLIRADLHELAKPHGTPHQLAEIEGGGPIPDTVFAAILAADPIVKVAITRGRDVTTIAHLGRRPDPYLRSALAALYPTCAIEGCDVTTGLEDHHVIAVADGGASSLENEVPLCTVHHDRITYDRWRLTGSHRAGWHLEPP